MNKIIAKFVLVFGLVGLLASTAHASSEQITNFASDVNVLDNGQVNVIETINYDFGDSYHHGIYRYIPTVYNSDKESFRPDLSIDSVMVDGQSANLELSTINDNKVIKIGNANTTITGPHVYVISYHFKSLVVNKGGDLLRFNVTGADWKVPINNVSATIHGPAAAKFVCYAGVAAAVNSQDCTITGSGLVTAINLGNGSQLTVEALWPAGTVSNHLQPYKAPWWDAILTAIAIGYVAVGALLLLAGLIRLLVIKFKESRAKRSQTIIAQYEPPANLTPGELGLLMDNRANSVEITATLVQAAVLGYIKIEQTQEKSMFKKAQYKLTNIKNMHTLEPQAQALLSSIFSSGPSVNLNDVETSTLQMAVGMFKKALTEQLKKKGLYTKQPKAPVAIIIVVVLWSLAVIFTRSYLAAVAGVLPLGLFVYWSAGRVPRLSPSGLETWAHLEGFKLFLTVTEKDRLAFTDAPAKTPQQFSKLLPYAIALGVEKEWAKQFENMDISQATGWYGGPGNGAFTAGYLVGNLGDSFAPSITAAATPQTSSSGFGGGSAGGGFGGGGGGSW